MPTRICALVLIGLLGCGSKAGNNGSNNNGTDCMTDSDCTSGVCGPNGVCVECETGNECPVEAAICDNGTCVAGCAGDQATAMLAESPSDIIFIVDQSGSMDQETVYVQQKINDFVALIDPSGIDYRVVMIADPNAGNAICVPPPLGGANCGNNTRFRLVAERVSSHNGPELVITEYSRYSDFLRLDAMKHFVFVTDDESALTAAQFTSMLQALQPTGMFASYKVHGIYAYGMAGGNGCSGPFGAGAGEGLVYTELIAQTGGASGVICTGDWTTVFADISQAVLSGSRVACDFPLPAPPMGESLDPSRVNVRYLEGGMAPGTSLPKAMDAAACDPAGGWYYDNDAAPTTVTLCPASCSAVQADAAADIRIEFGCSTVIL